MKTPSRPHLGTTALLSLALLAFAAAPAFAAVTDISGNLTDTLDTVVGAGNSARLVANAKTIWYSTTSSSAVDLNGFEFNINNGGGNAQTYNGAITGAGTLRIQGNGAATWVPDIQLAGASVSTVTNVILDYGRLTLNKTPGSDAFAGTITVSSSTNPRLIWLSNSNQINDAAKIIATNGTGVFTLTMNGFNERIGTLAIKTGNVVDTGAGSVLNVDNLIVDGVAKPRGAYTVSSGYVLGAGYIDVQNFGPPVIVNPPGAVSNPSPTNTASNVHPAYLAKLTWTAATDATSYDVYLWLASQSKPVSPAANVVLNEYTLPAQVLSLTNYNWQVVAKNSIGTNASPVWSFSTVDRRDISGSLTAGLDTIVGAGPARLVGDTTMFWASINSTVDINLNGFQLTHNSGGGNAQTYNGAISGPGTLRTIGRGDATWGTDPQLAGTTANTMSGVTVQQGHLVLNKTAGVDALAGPITVSCAAGNAVRIELLKSNQINDASVIDSTTSGGSFTLQLDGFNETIGGLSINTGHTVDTGSGGVLTTAVLMIDGTVMGAGTYTAATHDFVTGSGSVAVTTGGRSAFDVWAAAQGLSGAAAAFGADPDNDGLSNGFEFLLGGDPNPAHPGANSAALRPTAALVGDNLVFTYTRALEAAYLNPSVEFSTNLPGAWTTAVHGVGGVTIDDTTDVPRVTVAIPRGTNAQMFARLRIAPPVASGIAPRITTAPQGITVVGGGDFTLTAAAGGEHGVTWQWYLNGIAIAGATGSSYSVTGASLANEGNYQVVVSNSSGSATSAIAHVSVSTTPGTAGLNLIPWPLTVTIGSGTLALPAGARIVATDPTLLDAANVLAGEIAASQARTLPVVTSAPADGDIVLALDASLTGERHTLTVDSRATVRGRDAWSVSLGTSMLLQALRTDAGSLVCPRVTIVDEPAVPIRAVHLDLARQNHSLESLLQEVDLCRLYKANYLHLHFNDDQGYSFPSTAYPLLNTVTTNQGRKVYTLAEMQQLESYSVARGVHIMPELEGPGHNALMLAAYPALFQITYPYDPNSTDPTYPKYLPSSSINVAKAEVRDAVHTLIGEMCAVFQSTPYFHLGCDEVDWAWSAWSTDFQAAFALWGFNRTDPNQNVGLVNSKFISLARGWAAEYGKQSVVWENGAVYGSPEVPASTDILVMPFDSYNPGSFTSAGFKLVNAAWSPLYLVSDIRKPVSSIYAWDISIFGQYSGENIDYVSHIVNSQYVTGAQLTTFEQIEDMEMMSTRCRLAAMNERIGNPSLGASYDNFRSRLASTDALLDAILSPVVISYEGLSNPDDRVFSSTAIITMSLAPGSVGQGLTIRYTTNQTDVTSTSALYTGPYQVHDNGYLRAAAFNASGQRVGRMVREMFRHEMTVVTNLAAGKPVTASSGNDAADAVDLNPSQGWDTTVSSTNASGEILTVDLQSAQSVDRVALLFDPSGTYFYRVQLSLDNTAWTTVVDTSTSGTAATRAGVTHSFATTTARYVRLILLPHSGNNGAKTVREIMVTGNPTPYTGFNDPAGTKTAWVGRNVAFLTSASTKDPVTMDKLTTTFDGVYDYYAEATGRLPAPDLLYQGRSVVVQVTNTCGAGCGLLGATGIELESGTFDLLYNGVLASDQYEQTLFYEFGRNFYFYDGKIRYLETGPMAAPAGQSGWIGTGYAVLMRFGSMDATGVKPGPFGGTPFATFRASVEGMVDTYVATPSLNFTNTMLINQSPPGGGTTDFFASFCLRLAKWYGPQVLTRMWHEIGARTDAATTQDAVDNWFLGCCYGTERNLSTLFTTTWKIPVSAAAQSEALTRWGDPVTTFP